MRRTYTLNLERDNEQISVDLRLDIEGVLAIKKKFSMSPVEFIPDTIQDPEKLVFLFDQALNYPGNKNIITKGKELYNLLVDNGKAGLEGFWDIVSGIAVESGVISEKMGERMNANITKTFDNMFAEEEPEKNA